MQKKPASINLLKQKTGLAERFINWALTVGRLLVIVTEIVALSAFVYRFSLDRQLIDLHSKIVQEQAIVNYLRDSEATYRNLQDRLSLTAKYSALGINRFKALTDIIGFTPIGMSFNSLTLYGDQVKVNANVNSVSSLSIFVNALRNYSAIDSVSVDKIESKPSSAVITITITATLKPNLIYAIQN